MEVLRSMKSDEWTEVARMIHQATNHWYVQNGKAPVFNCEADDLLLFCEIYEAMDPGCCLVIEKDGVIAASCFYHPRETHYSLGIMCVHPDFAGYGFAGKLLKKIIARSEKEDLPLRLISSAQNLDSFSLYNKYGFSPEYVFQDMLVQVPESGFGFENDHIRPAVLSDLDEMINLEMSLYSRERRKDYEYMIQDDSGVWNSHVYCGSDGSIEGFLFSVKHPSSNIIGPGVMQNPAVTAALIKSHLDYYRGMSPLVIIPSNSAELVQEMRTLKARNCELHITQVYKHAEVLPQKGVFLPSFLPE
jgi:GNAT superfamily N-acetyltransferase